VQKNHRIFTQNQKKKKGKEGFILYIMNERQFVPIYKGDLSI